MKKGRTEKLFDGGVEGNAKRRGLMTNFGEAGDQRSLSLKMSRNWDDKGGLHEKKGDQPSEEGNKTGLSKEKQSPSRLGTGTK